MKFNLTFKTPGVCDDIKDNTNCDACENFSEDCDKCFEKHEEALNLAKKFVTYSEYITVEFDTEAKTAIVPLLLVVFCF